MFAAPINHEEWFGYTMSTTVKDGSDMRRCIDLAESLLETINDMEYPPAIAVFEDYGPINRTSGKITQRAEICGILKHHLTKVVRIPIITVSPNGLKKFATGKGKASKDEIMNAAHNEGFTAGTSDEADAFFAAKLGAYILAGRKPGVEYNRLQPL